MKSETPETPTDRRAFLAKCGKYAIVTPPAVTLMLAASKADPSFAGSGFGQGNNGFGNGGHDGVPGRSSHQDVTR